MTKLLFTILGLSGIFMAVGGLFMWHAMECYEDMHSLMVNVIDLIVDENARKEGTD